MTLRNMIERLRIHCMVEIRDEENEVICLCATSGKGVYPYLKMEVIEWFVVSTSSDLAVFVVLLNTSKRYVSEDSENHGEWLWIGEDLIKWACSICGRGVKIQENFCPQCGQRMKVERSNNTCEWP